MAVGDCLTGKTVHVHAKHYKHNEDGRTVPGVCGNGSVPLSHSGNVVTRTRIHIHTQITFGDELALVIPLTKWRNSRCFVSFLELFTKM